ncbi:thiamine pyrophosphate-dependent enzyme [Sorangium sp. So ce362]|uniref:thiamine pyrophosphate-dependent enzyme n=1 Tax=Sorangium sp. So ce362 TaxID=3133303 RepID=UPI003F641F57
MNKREALEVFTAAVGEDDLVVHCHGMIGRELYATRDRPSNFYMIGSMDLGLSIGLGLALAQPRKRVFVLDGDSNVLMGMNALASVGSERPANLLHVVIANRSHASTGGQRTISGDVKLESVASAVGYRATHRADAVESLDASLRAALVQPGPVMVLALVEGGAVQGIGRVVEAPPELAARFAAEARR